MAKACFFCATSGPNARLWNLARYPMPARDSLFAIQEELGVDQPEALEVPASENLAGRWDVVTFGSPEPSSYTQEAWLSVEDAILASYATLRPLAGALVWVADDTKGGVVTMGGASTVFTALPHGLVVTDRVLIVRAGSWAYRTIGAVGTSTSFVVTAPLAPFNLMAGDQVFLVSKYLSELYLSSVRLPTPSGGAEGHFYGPEIRWSFQGNPVTRYNRATATLAYR